MDTNESELSSLPCVPAVIHQHAEDAACLHAIRTRLTASSHAKLRELRRFDDRLAAHLDGLIVAGAYAWPHCAAALTAPTASAVFAAAVPAIERKEPERLNHLYALAEAIPEARPGLVSAFGWVDQQQLRGIVAALLASSNSFQRLIGVKVCAIHRVDARLRDAISRASNPILHSRALRASGELGQLEQLPACLRALGEESLETRFWAAWSAVMLGNRGVALETLTNLSEIPKLLKARAFHLALQAMDQESAHTWLRELGQNPENARLLIQGSGLAGVPTYVSWLIRQMSDLKIARLAGEAFSLITGLDLAHGDLKRKPPEGAGAGPNDDPTDANVAIDEDDGLPWPDAERISRWWEANGSRFTPGSRYFLGSPVTRENCLQVLKEGFQRQRILAAHYLCLLEPGTVLFEWRAPAFRQQRLLAAMI
jgi:uncharacterized protein (TIGR02270 family)